LSNLLVGGDHRHLDDGSQALDGRRRRAFIVGLRNQTRDDSMQLNKEEVPPDQAAQVRGSR
jgi:hypothetical protein